MFVIGVLLLVIGVFLWQRLNKRAEWINVRLIVANDEWWWEGQQPQWWYVDELKTGEIAHNSFGEKVAEITNVDSFDNGGYKRRAFIDLRLKGSYDKQRQIYIYNFQPLQIGKPLDLTFGKNNIHGLISYIQDMQVAYKDQRIEVRLKQIDTWVADSYKVGMEMKDSQGRTLAKIVSIDVQPYNYFDFSDIRGQLIQVTNPDYRQAKIVLDIKTFESGGYSYFVDRAVIKLGEKIWFQFPQAVIRDSEIVKIF
jgi:hypothetical protein